mmetsp:Transcript_13291/g.30110  ORF Transcript_13291/g.30110 Transcript_13291/m.30110 type:complete len:293 (+) Transcript_13291:1-879(+)
MAQAVLVPSSHPPPAMQLIALLLAAAQGATPLRIIGAGLGRTATSSLKQALDQLGYKAYHMERAMKDKHLVQWGQVGLEGGETQDINTTAAQAMFDMLSDQGYDATLDYPTNMLYKMQMKRYPDAKVILSVRKNAAVWSRSFVDTIGHHDMVAPMGRFPMNWLLPGAAETMRWVFRLHGFHRTPEHSLEEATEAYNEWNSEVQQFVPQDKLLVHRAEEGWPPLCTFLGVSEADCPSSKGVEYPHTDNDRTHVHKKAVYISLLDKYWGIVLVLPITPIVGILWFVSFVKLKKD